MLKNRILPIVFEVIPMINKKYPILYNLLFLPLRSVFALCFFSAVVLSVIFSSGAENSVVSYCAYVFSFYSLTVLSVFCAKVLPVEYNHLKKAMRRSKYINLYFTDAKFKAEVNLYHSLAINFIYAIIKLVSSAIYNTAWFAIFAVYYVIMAIMRYLLVRHINRVGIDSDRSGELRRARLCLIILMNVTLLLSGAVLMMIQFGRGFNYQGMLIYVMAAYCFYITTNAIVDLVRNKGKRSPILSVAAVIRLTAAMISMLALETAMFAQFGAETSDELRRIMIICTGAAISIIITVISVYLIITYTKELNALSSKSRHADNRSI